jgi:hypothetical protein
LCLAIVGPPTVQTHLSEVTQIVIIRFAKMGRQLATLQMPVSSVAQSVLGHSPTEAFRVDIVDKMFAKFWE